MKIEKPVEGSKRKKKKHGPTGLTKYSKIWKKVQNLKKGQWLPVELGTSDEATLLATAAYNRNVPMRASRRGLTVYLSLKSRTSERPLGKKLSAKLKDPVSDLNVYLKPHSVEPKTKRWDHILEKVKSLKEGEWLPIVLTVRADCHSLRQAAYAYKDFPLTAIIRDRTVYLRKPSIEQIAIRKAAKMTRRNIRRN